MIRTTVLLVALVAATSPLSAQALSLQLGGVRVEYADSVSGTAAFVAARLSAASASTAGVFEASVSEFATGEWAVELGGYGTALRSLTGGLAMGVAAGGDASALAGGTWSGSGGLGPLVVAAAGPTAASLGLAVGGVRSVGGTTFTTGMAAFQVRRTLAPGWVGNGSLSALVADSLRYLDATAGVGFIRSPWEMVVSGGARVGDLADGPWASARLAYAVTPWAVLEGAVGRYPPDITGFNDGLFATVAIRVNVTREARARWQVPRSPLRVERGGSGGIRVAVEVDAGRGDRVEIAGNWNGWLPEPLRREGSGQWVIDLRLKPGVYKFALVVNGEAWMVPEGVTTVPDEFGGQVALLVVR